MRIRRVRVGLPYFVVTVSTYFVANGVVYGNLALVQIIRQGDGTQGVYRQTTTKQASVRLLTARSWYDVRIVLRKVKWGRV